MVSLNPFDFEEIKLILEKDSEGPVTTTTPYNKSVWFMGKENELYLKYLPKTLIVSRIQLEHKRSGLCTKIFDLLKKYAIEHGFEKIQVESTITPEMNRFCLKYGFKPMEHRGIVMNNEFFGDYELKIV